MEVIGFTSDEVTSLFQLIGSILKLGNIEFSHRSNDDGTDGCDLSNTSGKFLNHLKWVSDTSYVKFLKNLKLTCKHLRLTSQTSQFNISRISS